MNLNPGKWDVGSGDAATAWAASARREQVPQASHKGLSQDESVGVRALAWRGLAIWG